MQADAVVVNFINDCVVSGAAKIARHFACCRQHAVSGEPVVVDGEYKVLDVSSLNDQIVELFAEETCIEVGEYSSNFAPLFAYLDSEEFDMLLSGQEANCYDRLLDIWEAAMEQTEEGAN